MQRREMVASAAQTQPNRKRRPNFLDSVGGEPLEDSGLENETPEQDFDDRE